MPLSVSLNLLISVISHLGMLVCHFIIENNQGSHEVDYSLDCLGAAALAGQIRPVHMPVLKVVLNSFVCFDKRR